MRVLITNNTLACRAGTELYVRDVALRLLARGHAPIAYSRVLGEVAEELRRGTVPVVEDLAAVGAEPDLIHGHHHLEILTAAMRFPRVPVVAFCHGWEPWEEAPVSFPTLRRWVAVDEPSRERLVSECGVPPARVSLHLNFVDLDRFRPRGALPERPRRALVFGNLVSEDNILPAVRAACDERGIELDAVGIACGNPCPCPERILGDYDLVFARGRAALEAAAVGTAVVLCDQKRLGPMVTAADLDRLRSLNLGLRLLSRPVTPESVAGELARYDAADVAKVRRQIRTEAGLDEAMDRLVSLYAEVLEEHRRAGPPDLVEMARAASRYLRHGPLRGGDPSRPERERLRTDLARCHGGLELLRGDRDRLAARCLEAERQARSQESESGELRASLAAERAEAERLCGQSARLQIVLQEITSTVTWRLRERLLGWRWLRLVYRWLRPLPPSDS